MPKTPGDFTGESYPILREELMSIFPKLFQKGEERRTLSNSFHEAHVTLIPKTDKKTRRKDSYRPMYLMKIDTQVLGRIPATEFMRHDQGPEWGLCWRNKTVTHELYVW